MSKAKPTDSTRDAGPHAARRHTILPDDVAEWTKDFVKPLDAPALTRIAATIDLFDFGPPKGERRNRQPTPIADAMNTLLAAIEPAQRHWQAEANSGHISDAEADARAAWLASLRHTLVPIRPDWLLEENVSRHTVRRHIACEYVAEVIAREMIAAGITASDANADAPLVRATARALTSLGITGRDGKEMEADAVSQRLRSKRPDGGWGAGNAPPFRHVPPRSSRAAD